MEEWLCEGDQEKTISCSADEGLISIIPGTFYGIANEHICNGSNVRIPERCNDIEAHEEAASLWVYSIIIISVAFCLRKHYFYCDYNLMCR